MSIDDLEQAIKQLTSDELKAFRAWFAAHDSAAWDRQFEADVQAGRLDTMGQEALREFREGRSTKL